MSVSLDSDSEVYVPIAASIVFANHYMCCRAGSQRGYNPWALALTLYRHSLLVLTVSSAFPAPCGDALQARRHGLQPLYQLLQFVRHDVLFFNERRERERKFVNVIYVGQYTFRSPVACSLSLTSASSYGFRYETARTHTQQARAAPPSNSVTVYRPFT